MTLKWLCKVAFAAILRKTRDFAGYFIYNTRFAQSQDREVSAPLAAIMDEPDIELSDGYPVAAASGLGWTRSECIFPSYPVPRSVGTPRRAARHRPSAPRGVGQYAAAPVFPPRNPTAPAPPSTLQSAANTSLPRRRPDRVTLVIRLIGRRSAKGHYLRSAVSPRETVILPGRGLMPKWGWPALVDAVRSATRAFFALHRGGFHVTLPESIRYMQYVWALLLCI